MLAGITAGTILLNCSYVLERGMLESQIVQYNQMMLYHKHSVSLITLFRIILFRMGMLVVLLYLVDLIGNEWVLYPVVFLVSTAFGYTLSVLSILYGVSGLFCMAAYMFPQWLIYMFAFVISLKYYYGNFLNHINKRFIIFISFLILAGCFAEVYVNPCFARLIFRIILLK